MFICLPTVPSERRVGLQMDFFFSSTTPPTFWDENMTSPHPPPPHPPSPSPPHHQLGGLFMCADEEKVHLKTHSSTSGDLYISFVFTPLIEQRLLSCKITVEARESKHTAWRPEASLLIASPIEYIMNGGANLSFCWNLSFDCNMCCNMLQSLN